MQKLKRGLSLLLTLSIIMSLFSLPTAGASEGYAPANTTPEPTVAEEFNLSGTEIWAYEGAEANVVIPAYIGETRIAKIGQGAFITGENIGTIVIPSSVVTIGDYAFDYQYTLTDIYFYGDAPYFDVYAFDQTSTDITFHCKPAYEDAFNDAVDKLGTWSDITVVADIDPDLADPAYTPEGGGGDEPGPTVPPEPVHTYSYELREGEAWITGYDGTGGELILPEECVIDGETYPVTGVKEGTFCGSGSYSGVDFSVITKITKITVPATIKTVEKMAFNYVGRYGTKEWNLEEIVFLGEDTIIGASALGGNPNLTQITLPGNLTEISSSLFSKNTALVEIEIPATVTAVGANAFSDCTSLETVTFLGETAPTMATYEMGFYPTYPFVNSGDDVTIIYPAGSQESYETVWSKMLAADPKYAGNITLQDDGGDITTVADFKVNSVEYHVTDLENKTVEVKYVDINNQGALTIPAEVINKGVTYTVTGIGANAMTHSGYQMSWGSSSYNFSAVTFPDTLTYIGKWGCAGLVNATEIDLSQTKITEIGDYAFNNCNNVVTIKLPDTLTDLGAKVVEDKTGEDVTGGEINIGGITGGEFVEGDQSNIEYEKPADSYETTANIFRGCQSLQNIVVNDTNPAFTSIDGVLFNKDCSKLIRYPVGKEAAAYEIPEGTKVIGEEAFMQIASYQTNGNLKSVSFPESLKVVENGAFRQSSITSVKLLAGVEYGRYVFDCCYALAEVEVEDGVTEIPDRAFWSCQGLVKINIPNSLKTIGESAFDRVALTSIDLNQVESIGDYAFYFSKLTEVTVPASVKAMGTGAFMNCAGLTTATLEEGVTELARYTFFSCTAMTELNLPESLDKIGENALGYCTVLSEIDLPDTVREIGSGAFRNCYSITEFTLPTGLQELGSHVFAQCVALKTATFPDGMGVTTVPAGTFYECLRLEEVNLGDSISSTEGTAFYCAGWYVIKNGIFGKFQVNCAQPEEFFFRNEFDTSLINLGESQTTNEYGETVYYIWTDTEVDPATGLRTYIFKAAPSSGGCGGNCGGGTETDPDGFVSYSMEESCQPNFTYGVNEEGVSIPLAQMSSNKVQSLQSALPTVLSVYTQDGEDGTPTLFTKYTLNTLEDMAKTDPTTGYQFVGMKGWAVMAATEYVELDDLLAGESFGKNDTLMLKASDGASYSITYEALQEYNQFFGAGQSLTQKVETDATTVPAILALSWNTGVIEGTDATDADAVARIAKTAYKSTNFRFACGLNWEDYEDLDSCEGMDPTEFCSGYRMLQKVESITVIHPASSGGSTGGNSTGGGSTGGSTGTTTDPDPSTSSFTDVVDGAWYADAVDYVVENGLFYGKSTNIFDPNGAITRAEFVTVLYRLAGSPQTTGTEAFADVSSGTYYTNAVIWGVGNGVVKGTSATTFSPDQRISREQMATFLYRYAQLKEYDLTKLDSLVAYADVGSIADYALSGMKWCVGNGIITGKSASVLAPIDSTSRAEVASMLMRFCQAFAD